MRVLVVDDTKNIRALISKCLELNGYTVKTAENGNAALDMIEKEQFDLAFLDIKMPQLSGTEVLRRMREMGINIPVIIITAYATVKNAIDCTQLGAVAYLQKPFTADKVKNVLEELLQRPKELQKPYTPVNRDGTDILDRARSLISADDLDGARSLLLSDLGGHPFSTEIYTLLAEVSGRLGDKSSGEKYLKLRDALL